MGGNAALVDHFVRHAVAVAPEHIVEAEEEQAARPDLLTMAVLEESVDGSPVVEAGFRVDVALNHPLVCLWGPPSTGKTQMIVEMIIVLRNHSK